MCIEKIILTRRELNEKVRTTRMQRTWKPICADVDDLPDEVRSAALARGGSGQGQTLADVEREHILAALKAAGGNKARAATRLGIGQATLFRKLKQYGVAGAA